MADSISNSEDIIDSRDVIKRIAELEDERDMLDGEVEDARTQRDEESNKDEPDGEVLAGLNGDIDAAEQVLAEWNESDDGVELKALQSLQEQAEGYTDWTHGATLIRDSYFETYARDLAEDLHGDSMGKAEWPFTCIDWEKAARELQADYTGVDFDGIDYWIR